MTLLTMKMLRAKLMELKAQQHAEKISDIKGVQMKIEWGSQIRSYVFMCARRFTARPPFRKKTDRQII